MSNLKIGQIISAPFLASNGEIKKIEARSGYYLIEVVLQDGKNTFVSQRLSEQQYTQIEIVEESQPMLVEDAEKLFFLIEAHRIRLAYQFDPQLAVSVSQVDPLPHQIEAVYHYVLNSPRIRFLIADDPGAGKTVMAGLILKELQYRRLVKRILIIAPGHLKYQWQREMKEKFQTTFAIVDRGRMESAWGENVWDEKDHLITSIDFIKQDDVRFTLRNSRWDLIIVDEAHKMSAYAYPSKERVKIDKTKRYQVGEIISKQADHLLFLTATPHRGDEENFRLFLDLLRPGFFAQTELLRESVEAKENPVFIRRLKEDMRKFDNSPIFPPRHVKTVSFRLTPQEKELYNNVTDYVRDYFDKAKENRSISFALMILQRRLTSSTNAIYESLKRRKEKLEDLLELPGKISEDEDYLKARNLSAEELDDLEENERQIIEEKLLHLTIADNIDDVKAEITELEILVTQANQVREQGIESKLVGLRDNVLNNLGDRKLLIFTEFKDTLDYLTEKLQDWDYSVINIHGSMNMDARIQAEHDFRDNAQIMVATEAAGEGINLQFCSWMVNYDIPWNPNRLEQRMGRIHRYGQDFEVFIYNLVTADTREGQILDRLFDKMDKMREALGSDRVFDIISDIIPGSRLDELMKEAIFSQRRMEEIEDFIEVIDETTVQQTLDRIFLTSLATRHIDYTSIRKETLLAEENRLVPEYVQDYFLRTFNSLGGKIVQRENVFNINSVPFILRHWNDNYAFKTLYGTIFREYKRVTFNKSFARSHSDTEFIAPGHPLLEAINEEILSTHNGGQNSYAIFGDPEYHRKGVFWFVEGDVMDGTGNPAGKRVFCLFQSTDGNIQQVNSAILWDHEPLKSAVLPEEVASLLTNRGAIEDYIVTDVLMPYRDEIHQRREKECHIKEKYGVRSLDYLIQESNQKILDYQGRQAAGEAVELPLLNENRTLEQLQARRSDLQDEIKLERNLTITEPRILGVAAVIPLEEHKPKDQKRINEEKGEYRAGGGMHRDDGIEAVGMKVAMEYEKEQGWKAEDVSGENHGFDMRSTLYSKDGSLAEVRYIEVKARARTGAVRLSSNEWKKARHFEDTFWLYIVTDAGTDSPKLNRIQNPAAKFEEEKDIFVTGFILPEEKWLDKLTQE
ncbi:MAG: DUF3883 domain-containing protein [Anaerolineales bacterium]|nr:DUF3883 domain-containing protein [Anaerolineales bacterium]